MNQVKGMMDGWIDDVDEDDEDDDETNTGISKLAKWVKM